MLLPVLRWEGGQWLEGQKAAYAVILGFGLFSSGRTWCCNQAFIKRVYWHLMRGREKEWKLFDSLFRGCLRLSLETSQYVCLTAAEKYCKLRPSSSVLSRNCKPFIWTRGGSSEKMKASRLHNVSLLRNFAANLFSSFRSTNCYFWCQSLFFVVNGR